ncbi:MAG: 16S rRNA (cytosine(967)-C(5))-methyltransferase, partial [Gammaproteobacteria bacterium]|nr:16S rRNA (cytosine(967)-C(5))-methyltransferase [Gammaproteobacteria bacterium]
MNPRQAAVDILLRVIKNGEHLTAAISRVEKTIPGTQNQAFTKELCFGVLRWMPRLEAILGRLMERPLRNKDLDVRLILLLGIYQLLYTRVPPYAAVAESVSLAQKRKKGWARGLINGVLRHLQREWGEIAPALESQAGFTFSHPEWLIQAIRTAWPVNWQEILEQNNRHPPLTLRVNNRNLNRDRYLEILQQEGFPAQPTSHSADGIRLIQATAVEKLPRFAQGAVSVQDEAA